jgi:hypothetical protein
VLTALPLPNNCGVHLQPGATIGEWHVEYPLETLEGKAVMQPYNTQLFSWQLKGLESNPTHDANSQLYLSCWNVCLR